jgi:hypothetical protein
VSIKHKLAKALLCLVLGAGSLLGAPMKPDEIEELLHMDQAKVEVVINENDDHPSD